MGEAIVVIVDRSTGRIVHAQVMKPDGSKIVRLRRGSYSIYVAGEGYVTAKRDIELTEDTSLSITMTEGAPRFDELIWRVGKSLDANLDTETQYLNELRWGVSMLLHGDLSELNSELTIELSATEG